MTFINSKITYSNNTMTVLKSAQDEYTTMDGFLDHIQDADTRGRVQSVDLTETGFDIVMADAITETQALHLYHAVRSFCAW